MPDSVIDAIGLQCPMPIAKISSGIKKLNSGQTVEIKADDPAFEEDVRAFCRVSGNELESLVEADGVFTCVIKKN